MGEKKAGAAGAKGKKDGDIITAVFKVDMCCHGCADKIAKAIKDRDGVDVAVANSDATKLMVKGKVKPTALKEWLEKKTQKKVDLLSPQLPEKDGAAGGGVDQKAKKKDYAAITAVFKVDMNCYGCAKKIAGAIKHCDGVDVAVSNSDATKLMVKGKVNPTVLKEWLEEKTKKNVDLLSLKKVATKRVTWAKNLINDVRLF